MDESIFINEIRVSPSLVPNAPHLFLDFDPENGNRKSYPMAFSPNLVEIKIRKIEAKSRVSLLTGRMKGKGTSLARLSYWTRPSHSFSCYVVLMLEF